MPNNYIIISSLSQDVFPFNKYFSSGYNIGMKKAINFGKVLSRLLKNDALRLSISLFVGMILNFLYIASNLASAFLYRNIWCATLTVYHGIFLLLRFYLLSSRRRCKTDTQTRVVCLRTGIFLLFLDLAATLMMIYTIRLGSPIKYSGVVLVGFAIYTIYSLTASIRGVKKHSNDNQTLHFAARTMTLASALLSVFNLQYSLLITIGVSSYIKDRVVVISGLLVFVTIILLSVRLVVRNLPMSSKI